jgi:cytochrome P450
MIESLVDGLIDNFVDRSEVEFVSEFATPLPILVFCKIFFGDAKTDMERFQRWALREGTGARYLPDERREAAELMRDEVIEYMDANILDRHQNPRDDALSEIIEAQVARDGELDVEYLRSEASLLLSGGFVTTAHLISNAMYLLLHDAALFERVRANHDLIPAMIEEALRLESPVQWQQRMAVVDTEIGGVPIPAGSIVVVALASGNRDPLQYPEPGSADVDRPKVTRHLAFGHGIHFCLGAPLGRLEARIALERLFARLAEIRLAPGRNDFTHLDSPLFRGLKELHLQFRAT